MLFVVGIVVFVVVNVFMIVVIVVFVVMLRYILIIFVFISILMKKEREISSFIFRKKL